MLQSATVIRKTLILCAAMGLMAPVACDSGDDDTGGADGDTDAADDGGGGDIPAEFAGMDNPVDGDAAAIDAGMMTYAMSCALCHGDTGAGDGPSGMSTPPATDFTSVTNQADDYMLWRISEGVPGTTMAGYSSSLSQDQIWQVVSYIRTLQ